MCDDHHSHGNGMVVMMRTLLTILTQNKQNKLKEPRKEISYIGNAFKYSKLIDILVNTSLSVCFRIIAVTYRWKYNLLGPVELYSRSETKLLKCRDKVGCVKTKDSFDVIAILTTVIFVQFWIKLHLQMDLCTYCVKETISLLCTNYCRVTARENNVLTLWYWVCYIGKGRKMAHLFSSIQ